MMRSSVAINRGRHLLRLERYAESIGYFTIHRDLEARLHGGNSLQAVAANAAVADAYDRCGRAEEAKELYLASAESLERLGADQSLDYASTVAKLGLALHGLGENEAAIKHLERSLVIYRGLLPPSHHAIATILHFISRVQQELGRGAEAVRSQSEAFAIDRRS